MLYLSRVKLKNVRCFDELAFTLGAPGTPANWSVLVGDNATGKSTLLRSIAMGLCDEASAAGLLKESDEGYIRRGATKATIEIWLYDSKSASRQFRIKTTITRKKSSRGIFSDQVRQETTPKRAVFPWDELFLSGYGAGRGAAGTGDISSYSAIDAVYNMFNYPEGLQNPELMIRRLMDHLSATDVEKQRILDSLSQVIGANNMKLTSKGIRVDGSWGKGMPFRDLADGYKSSILWLTDLLGWALAFNPRIRTTTGIRGIVLVDELEQHLHARWQRTVVDDLRGLLPQIQFVVATHSPLIAGRLGQDSPERKHDNLYVLEARGAKGVTIHAHPFMRGWRMDQVLASRAFKYLIDDDPAIENMLREASILAGTEHRTRREELRYKNLNSALRPILMSDGQTLYERKWEVERLDEINALLRKAWEDLKDA